MNKCHQNYNFFSLFLTSISTIPCCTKFNYNINLLYVANLLSVSKPTMGQVIIRVHVEAFQSLFYPLNRQLVRKACILYPRKSR